MVEEVVAAPNPKTATTNSLEGMGFGDEDAANEEAQIMMDIGLNPQSQAHLPTGQLFLNCYSSRLALIHLFVICLHRVS